MSKLKMIRLYKTEDVPDHIVEEVNCLVNKLCNICPTCFEGHDINIVLSAMNRFHAAMVVHAVTERGLIEAAKTEAIGLIKNIEHISGQTMMKEE